MFIRTKIGIRLRLRVVVVAVALLAMAGKPLLFFRQPMMDDRPVNARHAVQAAYGVAPHFGTLAATQKPHPEEVQAQALASNEFEITAIGQANIQRAIVRQGGRTRAEGKVDGGATSILSLPHLVLGQI